MKEIFLLEDDEGIRELIQFLLISENFKVTAFSAAREFEKCMAENHPDLILLDVMLPDGNGIEICENLGRARETRHIPVILMSAHVDAGISEKDHARDFISKPFDINDFMAKVRRQVN